MIQLMVLLLFFNISWAQGKDIFKDIKDNSKLLINSIESTYSIDWKSGIEYTGINIPFYYIGSHLQLTAGYSKNITKEDSNLIFLGIGLKLNDFTRPILKQLIEEITLNKAPLLKYLAEGLNTGIFGGHDFNHDSKKIINRWGLYLGLRFETDLKTESLSFKK